MFKWFFQIRRNHQQKRLLCSFKKEVEKNLEIYYVMDQLAKPQMFELVAWKAFKAHHPTGLNQTMDAYGRSLELFNQATEDFIKYQQWYSLNLEHKTQGNARILDSKKENVFSQLKTLEPVIQAARADLDQGIVSDD